MGKARPGPDISILNLQRKVRLSLSGLGVWTGKILKELGWRRIRLSVAVVDDSQISRLHHRFLGVKGPTDVLAFSQTEGRAFPGWGWGALFLGDIAVSVETAKRAGPKFGNRWDEELLLYITHGVLHLMGYQDSTARRKAKMDNRQEKVLEKVLGKKWRSKRRKPLF